MTTRSPQPVLGRTVIWRDAVACGGHHHRFSLQVIFGGRLAGRRHTDPSWTRGARDRYVLVGWPVSSTSPELRETDVGFQSKTDPPSVDLNALIRALLKKRKSKKARAS
jgi:hypothetical protein